MSLRERVLTILGVVAVVGVVVYPLAHRITSQASASTPPASAGLTPAPASAPPPVISTMSGTPDPVVPAGDAWAATAEVHRGSDGLTFAFLCPEGGPLRPVWGSFLYTDDSSVCTAAVHAGILGLEDGGTIDIVILAGADAYEGSDRNGVESLPYLAWPGSFAVVAPAR